MRIIRIYNPKGRREEAGKEPTCQEADQWDAAIRKMSA